MPESENDQEIKIHLLPNILTAGNLFCGFLAVWNILEAHRLGGMDSSEQTMSLYWTSILFVFGACIFDLLDGRVARMAGVESPFGQEFDSLADIISFGLAPALLVLDIIMSEFKPAHGRLVAFIYLLCGAMRLARFNCLARLPKKTSASDFQGFPIPAAAGVICSVTLLMLHLASDSPVVLQKIKLLLPFLMLILSYLMFSKLRYPSFKNLHWKTQRSIPWVLVAIVVVIFTVLEYEWMLPLLFISYLAYGPIRPWISRRWRKEIEDLDEDESSSVESQRTESLSEFKPRDSSAGS